MRNSENNYHWKLFGTVKMWTEPLPLAIGFGEVMPSAWICNRGPLPNAVFAVCLFPELCPRIALAFENVTVPESIGGMDYRVSQW